MDLLSGAKEAASGNWHICSETLSLFLSVPKVAQDFS
jgi:hypothetical protein